MKTRISFKPIAIALVCVSLLLTVIPFTALYACAGDSAPAERSCCVETIGAKINKDIKGLRFGAKYTKPTIAANGYSSSDISDIGIVLLPEALIPAGKQITHETADVLAVSATGIDPADYVNGKGFDEYESFSYYITLVGIPDDRLNVKIGCRAFVKCEDEYLYSDGIKKSYDEVVAAESAPKIVIGNMTAAPGETVQVPVTIVNNPGLFGAIITYTFDDELTLCNAVAGSAFDGLDVTFPVYSSSFTVFCDGVSDPATADGVIMTLSFTVPSTAVSNDCYSINASYLDGDIVDGDFADVDIDIISGSITVE